MPGTPAKIVKLPLQEAKIRRSFDGSNRFANRQRKSMSP